MQSADSAATCVPVRLGGQGEWEAALFVHVSGAECSEDRRILQTASRPVDVELEARLMAHSSAALVSIELSIATVPDDPLNYEILLIPGRQETHYQAIKLLARQHRLCWFFGDDEYRVIQAQEQEIEARLHDLFESIARDAFAHDSLLRMSNQYDSDKAVAEIVSHYSPRADSGAGVVH